MGKINCVAKALEDLDVALFEMGLEATRTVDNLKENGVILTRVFRSKKD